MSCAFDGEISYNTATYASPTWVAMSNARDVNTSSPADKVEVSDRGSKFKKYCAGMLDLETSVSLTYRNGDTVISALRTHFLARTAVEIAVMDGPIATSGSEGFRYYAHVFSNDFDQPLTDGQVINVTFATAYYTDGTVRDPEWYTVP